MAVIGTNCALCALPVQHDHYVPETSSIYRGSRPDPEAGSPLTFTPEHAWLERAVGLRRTGDGPPRLHGRVEDATLTANDGSHRGSVMDSDEYVPFHEACWHAMGSPDRASDALRGDGVFENACLETYHAQLFELPQLVADGKAWMLADPDGTSPEARRSRERIEALVAAARRAAPMGTRVSPSAAGMLASGRSWTTAVSFDEDDRRTGIVRFRQVPWPFDAMGEWQFDLRAYPTLVCFIREYGTADIALPSPAVLEQLEVLEARLKKAVEEDDAAVHVATCIRRGQAEYYVYARDEQATMARIDALPDRGPLAADDYDNTPDPEWRIFFEDVDPRRRR